MIQYSLPLPCGAVIRNRLAKAAMTERLSGPDYLPNEGHLHLYETWAEAGAGLMITGNIMVDHRYLESAGNVAVENESAIPALKKWTAMGRTQGHHFWAQLSHPGRQTPIMISARPLAPSPIQLHKLGLFGRPRAMNEADIADVIHRFVRTAELCKAGGFTGVQIHAAHGYLINQFLSSRTNRRRDQWGGPLENRARLLLAIVRQTREVLGPEFPLSVKLNSADFQQGGFSREESLKVINWLDEAGIDLLEISGGTYENLVFFTMNQGAATRNSSRRREAYFLDFAGRVREISRLPLMVTGGFRTRAAVEEALASGDIDVAGMARPFITHPDLIAGFLSGEVAELPTFPIRTGVKGLEDMAEGGFYAHQIARLANGQPVDLNYPAWQGTVSLTWNELSRAVGKRIWGKGKDKG